MTLPILLMAVQWLLWDKLAPYAWALAYPAIIFSPLIGGTAGGIAATLITGIIVPYMFIEPYFSLDFAKPITAMAGEILFIGTGVGLTLMIRYAQRLKVRAAVAESERRFETLFEHAPLALCYVGADGRFKKINQCMEEVSGYRVAEIPDSATWFEKAYPDPAYRDHVIKTWSAEEEAARREGRPVKPQEYDIVAKDGTVKTMLFSASPIGDELLSFMADISPMKKARRELLQFNERLKEEVAQRTEELRISRDAYRIERDRLSVIINSLMDPHIEVVPVRDANGSITDFTITDANIAASAFMGQPRERLVGTSAFSMLPEEHAKRLLERSIQIFNTGTPQMHEDTPLPGSGQLAGERIVEIQYIPLGDTMIISWRDLTERVQSAQALARSEAILREKTAILDLALSASEVGVWTWDLKDNHLDWDERMYDLYEAPPDIRARTLNYDFWRSRVHPDDREQAERQLSVVIESPSPFPAEFRIVMPDGRVKYIMTASAIENDDSGVPIRMVGTNRDMTLQKTIEQTLLQAKMDVESANASLRMQQETLEETVRERTMELARSRDEAEAANRAKSAFLSTMSHEMRTPLNHIIGMGYLLKRDSSDPEILRRVKIMDQAGTQLLGMINGILNYTRLESESISLGNIDFSLESLCARALSEVEGAAREKGIPVDLESDPGIPPWLKGDPVRLGQILRIILGNALKFSDKGRVRLSANAARRAPSSTRVRFEVSDEGVGMTPETLRTLFTSFRQGDNSATRKHEGIGLGLAFARRLVTLMAGDIGASSEPGKGSIVWFEVDLPDGTAPEPQAADSASAGKPDHVAEETMAYLERLLADSDLQAQALWAESRSFLAPALGGDIAGFEAAMESFDFDGAHALLVKHREGGAI